MVGVDVQAHGAVALGAGVGRAHRAQGLGQHHADTAVQQTVGLVGALVHGHAAAHEVVADLQELDAQVRYGRAQAVVGERFDGDGFLPDGRHR